jgi:hypothetical protein
MHTSMRRRSTIIPLFALIIVVLCIASLTVVGVEGAIAEGETLYRSLQFISGTHLRLNANTLNITSGPTAATRNSYRLTLYNCTWSTNSWVTIDLGSILNTASTLSLSLVVINVTNSKFTSSGLYIFGNTTGYSNTSAIPLPEVQILVQSTFFTYSFFMLDRLNLGLDGLAGRGSEVNVSFINSGFSSSTSKAIPNPRVLIPISVLNFVLIQAYLIVVDSVIQNFVVSKTYFSLESESVSNYELAGLYMREVTVKPVSGSLNQANLILNRSDSTMVTFGVNRLVHFHFENQTLGRPSTLTMLDSIVILGAGSLS